MKESAVNIAKPASVGGCGTFINQEISHNSKGMIMATAASSGERTTAPAAAGTRPCGCADDTSADLPILVYGPN
jgi:hypothetical protein